MTVVTIAWKYVEKVRALKGFISENNVLPPSLISRNNISQSSSETTKPAPKYSLSNLFSNTPKFEEPHIAFKDNDANSNSLWGKVADMVLNSKRGNIPAYMNNWKSLNEDYERYSRVPFYFQKVSHHYARKITLRKYRRNCNISRLSHISKQFINNKQEVTKSPNAKK